MPTPWCKRLALVLQVIVHEAVLREVPKIVHEEMILHVPKTDAGPSHDQGYDAVSGASRRILRRGEHHLFAAENDAHGGEDG